MYCATGGCEILEQIAETRGPDLPNRRPRIRRRGPSLCSIDFLAFEPPWCLQLLGLASVVNY